MLIAQISDTHITRKGRQAYGVAPMGDNLVRCIVHINQLNPKPDLILVTGDITYSDHIDEYKMARNLLNKLDAPYFVLPGNHDSREKLLSVFKQEACPVDHFTNKQPFINYVLEDYAIRFIALDSTAPGEPGGEICVARAHWLNEALAKQPDKPTIIFTHHPPVKLSILETDVDGFRGMDKFANVVKRYGHIERILCGHVHLPTFTRWHGTIVSTAPSIGMQLLLDLSMKLPSQFLLEDPAYQLHHWTPENQLISHTINVRPHKKTYLFEE